MSTMQDALPQGGGDHPQGHPSGPIPAQDRWQAAAATIAPNESYVGARMLYRGTEQVEHGMADIADRVTARAILRRLRNGLVVIMIAAFGAAFSALGSQSDSTGGGSGAGSFSTFLLVVGLLYVGLALLLPMRETLSEWSLVVGDRADLSESAYATVAEELLYTHRVPAQVLPKRIFVRMPQPEIRNFLAVRLGKYTAVVSVFPFGRDLFLGWSLIRRDIPVVFLLRYAGRKLGSDHLGVSRLIDVEPVKALREVVHNALRTGIEAAAVRRELSVDAVFQQAIPVEDGDAPAARAQAVRDAQQPYQAAP